MQPFTFSSQKITMKRSRSKKHEKKKECRWENTIAITAISSFKTHRFTGKDIFKAFTTKKPKPSDHNHVTSSISNTNTNTGVCNRFIRTGSCPYGDSCKYLHPNQNLQNRNMQGFPVTNSMETQLASFPRSRSIERSSLPGGMVLDRTGFMVGNLPPSLRPPPEGGYPPLPFVDWG